MRRAFRKLDTLLASGRRVVISDCFRAASFTGGRMIGGGHKYSRFLEAAEAGGYRIASNEDVTALVAPSIALDAMIYRDAVAPVVSQFATTLERRSRLLSGLARRAYRVLVRRSDRKQLAERLTAEFRTPELFKANNTYRFLTLTRA